LRVSKPLVVVNDPKSFASPVAVLVVAVFSLSVDLEAVKLLLWIVTALDATVAPIAVIPEAVIFANSVFPVIVRTVKSEEVIVKSARSVLSVTTIDPSSFFLQL